MGIIGVGIDVVHVPRLVSLVTRRTPAKFASRILSPSEFMEWEILSPPTTSTSTVTPRDSNPIGAESVRFPNVTEYF